MRRSAAVVASVVLAVILAGCGSETTAPISAPSPALSAGPAESAEPEAVEADFPEQGTPEWAALSQDEQIAACEASGSMFGCPLTSGECATFTFAAPDDPVQVAGWKPEVPTDQGPREYATGEVVLDAAGIPVAYRVAAGDIPDFVAERLCMNLAYLHAINSVRRASLANELYAGDTINLDATTIFTVGDQNGVVHEGDPPLPHPPQR